MTTFEAMPHSGSLMAQRSLSGHTRGIGQMPLHSSRGSANSFTANGPRMPQTVFTDQTNMGTTWSSAEANGGVQLSKPCTCNSRITVCRRWWLIAGSRSVSLLVAVHCPVCSKEC